MIRWLQRSCLLSLALLFVDAAGAQEWELRVCAETDNLPYSDQGGEGFENRIAEILLDELGAQLAYVWLDGTAPRTRRMLIQRGDCDLVMGTTEGHPDMLTTIAYYRSTYVFLFREDGPVHIESFDDPDLHELNIGIQAGSGGLTPVAYALSKRGLVGNQVTFPVEGGGEAPLAGIVEAVVGGTVDVAIVWGPVAGYFADLQSAELTLVPVTPQIEPPFVPMVGSIAVGVRSGDEALRDDLNRAIARRWEEIQKVLTDFRVPLEPLPRPTTGMRAQ